VFVVDEVARHDLPRGSVGQGVGRCNAEQVGDRLVGEDDLAVARGDRDGLGEMIENRSPALAQFRDDLIVVGCGTQP
jgi:hypothetical protein